MATRILVPHDGSPLAARAIERVAERYPGSTVVILHVIDPIEGLLRAETVGLARARAWVDDARERAEARCAEASRTAAAGGCTVTTEIVLGPPGRAIVDAITDHAIDHVVMGSHGRAGVERFFLGSVSEYVLRRSPVSVTVVK